MNFLKKISAMMLIVAMVAFVMCGCGNDAQNTESTGGSGNTADTSYTVTVVDQNGNPVANVIMQLTDAEGGTQLAVTDATGVVTATSVTYVSVTLSSIPNGYSSDVDVVEFGSEKDLVITLQADEVVSTDITYTVTIVDQNGKPVPGVTLQLCDDENCKLPVVTDESGTASCTYEEADYHVSLTEIPDGYSSEETSFEFGGSTEITIVINAE